MGGEWKYQAKIARGLLASIRPIVLGRVACSIAYPLPVFLNSVDLLLSWISSSSSSPFGFAGGVVTAHMLTRNVRFSPLRYKIAYSGQLVMVSNCHILKIG